MFSSHENVHKVLKIGPRASSMKNISLKALTGIILIAAHIQRYLGTAL